MLRVFVTGASGFVGAHVARGLSLMGYEIFTQNRAHPIPPEVGALSKENQSFALEQRDQVRRCLEKIQPDVVIHAAASSDSSSSSGLHNTWASNVLATQILCDELGCCVPGAALIYVSSDLVFDAVAAPSGGFSEDAIPAPRSFYGYSKREAERCVLGMSKGIVVRSSLVYGQRIGEKEGFLGWMNAALKAGRAVTLYSDEWRTPIYVGDIVRGLCRVIQSRECLTRDGEFNKDEERSRILHFSGVKRISRYEFGLRYCQALGFSTSLLNAQRQGTEHGQLRARDVSLSNEKTKARLTFNPLDLELGLHEIASGSLPML